MGVVANGLFKGHSGFCALKTTVESSVAVIDSLFLRMYGDHGLVDSFEPNRWIEKTTSAAVSGSPLWNLMPLRMLNVHVSPSGLRLYFSATLLTTLPYASKTSSKSYSAPPHWACMTIGSIDSLLKSALATRSVPLGAAAELAAAVVGLAAATAVVGAAAAAGAVGLAATAGA